ncbi:MAG TPA: hypothetical protein VHP38_14300 [Ruminiclostridium sp.]|nr:hypothetical protein [Ruminiclostridium sp.]
MGNAKKLIGMGLGLAVLISSMGFAFAADSGTSSNITAKPGHHAHVSMEKGNWHKINVMDSLVKAGTITADQQKAIMQAIKPSKEAQKSIKESLDSLVTAGTITQAQEDAVVKAFDDAKAQMTADMEKKLEEIAAKKGITVDQLKAQMAQQKPGFKRGGFGGKMMRRENPLDSLVKAETITADQQKAIMQAIKPSKEAPKPIKESLDSLVTAGTITQAQEDAVVKAFDDAKAQMTANMEKKLEEIAAKKGITVDQLKAQMAQQKPGFERGGFDGKMMRRENPLDSLVKAGTITADQQKAIMQAIKPSKEAQKPIKESLDSLVTAGTITQAQEDAVVKAFDVAKAQMTADMQKRLEEIAAKKGITVDQLKTQMEQGRKALQK